MSRKKKQSFGKTESTRLFHFTDEEEMEMACAIEDAIHYMENYGKGEKIDIVDRRHYCQNG